VRSSHITDRLHVAFDDGHLVAQAGLVLPATLSQHLGLAELFAQHVDLGEAPGHANVGPKAMTLIASALAGGDSISDADALRAGASEVVLGHGVLAPSTLGTFLRSFSWGHAKQLEVVSQEALKQAWRAGAGPGQNPLTIDLDSTICETYGLLKQGGRDFTHTHVRGYHPLLATAAESGEVLHSRLRGGSANSGRGAPSFVNETLLRVRRAGARGQLRLRADSGFYSRKVVEACRKHGCRFSISVRLNQGVRRAIEQIPEEAWQPIPYWLEGAAEVAETSYQPFGQRRPVRLIVRRVEPTPGSQLYFQGVLFTHHPFITDREGDLLQLEADHRRHAVVENVIRDLKYGVGLNHLPSGKFGANAAWLALNVLAHNLARWLTRLAFGPILMSTKRLRRRLFALPGRLVRSGRRSRLRLPQRWPWEMDFMTALVRLRSIAIPVPLRT
jgi:Transposase DDE domain group 1